MNRAQTDRLSGAVKQTRGGRTKTHKTTEKAQKKTTEFSHQQWTVKRFKEVNIEIR